MMASKKKLRTHDEIDASTKDMMEAINTGPDHVCAIVATAFVEEAVSRLLANYLIDDTNVQKELIEYYGKFGGPAQRVLLCFALGLISDRNKTNIEKLLHIRNEFAHSLSSQVSFTSPVIAKKCRELTFPELVSGSHEFPAYLKESRMKFCTISTLTTLQLHADAKGCERRKMKSS